MKKMSWIRSSRVVVLVVLLALALGVAGTAMAIDFNEDDVPTEAEVGSTEMVTVSYDVDQTSPSTVEAESELDDAVVSITASGPGSEVSDSGDTAEVEVDPDEHSEVEIEANGDIPEIMDYDYEDQDVENVVGLSVSEDGASVGTWEIHRYTEDSQEARQALDDARDAVEDSNSESAQSNFDRAVTLYNSGEFESAIETAQDAQDDAESEGQMLQLLLTGGAVLGVIALIGGGVYYWRSRQQDNYKLQ